MATTSAIAGLPRPSLGDIPNIPGDFETLTDALDQVVIPSFASASARNLAIPAPADGQFAYLRDSHTLTHYDSGVAGWVTVGRNSKSISAVAVTSGTDTTTSAAYVNMAGTGATTSFSFTKRQAGTQLKVEMAASMYTATSSSAVYLGVQINGTDYDIMKCPLSTAATHSNWYGFRHIPGIPAGTYTVQARWYRYAGPGTPTRAVDDWLSVCVSEEGA